MKLWHALKYTKPFILIFLELFMELDSTSIKLIFVLAFHTFWNDLFLHSINLFACLYEKASLAEQHAFKECIWKNLYYLVGIFSDALCKGRIWYSSKRQASPEAKPDQTFIYRGFVFIRAGEELSLTSQSYPWFLKKSFYSQYNYWYRIIS